MSRFVQFAVLAAIGALASSALFAYRATPARQLATMALWLVTAALAVGALAHALTAWKTRRWGAVLPLLILAGTPFVAVPVARGAQALRQHKLRTALPHFETVVDAYRSGRLQQDQRFPLESLPPELSGCCYLIRSWRDSAGLLGVEFFTDGGWPVRHSGVAWFEDTVPRPQNSLAKRWRRGRHLKGNWYWVVD